MARIMIIDDEKQILKALERTLRPLGHEIALFSDPNEALSQIELNRWDLILVDFRMPLINGLSVLKTAKEKDSKAIRVLMTGYADIDVIIQAINEGNIFKYISKPWDNHQLLQVLDEALQHKSQQDDNDALVESVLNENSEWSSIAKSLEHKMLQMSEQGIQALLRVIQAKDHDLYVHSLKVAWIAKTVGESISLRKGDLQTLRLAALFHDIGKIAIRDSILFKEGALEPDERAQMIHHPMVGAKIIKEMDFMQEVSEVILQHHERHDGAGYPQGISGSHIKVLARILSASDIYVALLEERSYKGRFTSEEALEILRNESGKGVDPLIVEKFLSAVKDVVLPENINELGGLNETFNSR